MADGRGRLWDFERSIAHGPKKKGLADVAASLEYWKDLKKDVDRKGKAGFDTSFTDYWGRALSQQLIDASDGGPSMADSSSREQRLTIQATRSRRSRGSRAFRTASSRCPSSSPPSARRARSSSRATRQ
jgi:hypothetical protein